MLDVEGRVLDGRNRLLACERAGVLPRFEPYQGEDAGGYALSVNIARRHLNEGQRDARGPGARRDRRARAAGRTAWPGTGPTSIAQLLHLRIAECDQCLLVLFTHLIGRASFRVPIASTLQLVELGENDFTLFRQ